MDSRYETFLTLCHFMNYRKTAEELHLTQPAVTRQIQSLEAEFGTRLFLYDRRKLSLTPAAKILQSYIISLRHNYAELKENIRQELTPVVRIGATKTIGDYVIPAAVEKYLSDDTHNLSLEINNTEVLLGKLKDSQLDFALIEGIFDKSRYNSKILSRQKFFGICAKNHPLAGQECNFAALFPENLIIREKGSGTRDIFESELRRNGYSVSMFRRATEISSSQIISRLVAKNMGISFAYEAVIAGRSDIATFRAENLELVHEFNIVWLKHTEIPQAGQEFLAGLEAAG